MKQASLKGAAGFTLIELMIVVAIIGLLSAIAYPNYVEYVRKSKRADGKALLNRIAGEQERFFTARGQYTNALTTPKPNGLGFANNQSEQGCYTATIALGPGNMSYTLTATPASSGSCGNQALDTKCGTLSINNLGVKGATGTDGPGRCW
ncbi:type IV pilin protein [Pseudofulvimonas gallinarii]|jgi:type IV pilus assembly protein PilE|uniref:Type IV pilus assembly protein PilE n=1 Tax=Pseudofulvimonas gallinarii TaxID=634155 RepID=A0A4S3KV51_9GAMM|nr:type IV pilin protein [Pseudofulvimonas gallinarii]TCS94029.1 type IV pilus assembly protein PilE [Pseudofulvimonas gallinarii]THD13026.1 hypothetical protein B1808_10310 [Pseudofulvimonas gallinarii]